MNAPKRFYSLDAVRGLAALAVVFNHWKHFAMQGSGESATLAFTRAESPLYAWLYPLYEYGWVAVDFFFTLSGFVFFWLYAEAIGRGEVRAGRFALLRATRLYPLHLFTLCLVAALQFLHHTWTGGFAIYPDNDGASFLLHLLFLSGLSPEGGHSFNAPVWSVSIEVVLYALFFLLCLRPAGRRPAVLFVLVLAGLGLQFVHPNLGRGIASFFLGGLTQRAYASLVAGPSAAAWVRRAPGMLLVAALGVGLELGAGLFSSAAEGFAAWPVVADRGGALARVVGKLPHLALVLVAFPLVMLGLTLLETGRGKLLGPIAALGDWSYAAYLLHVPLQLLLILACLGLGLERDVFREPLALPLFFGALCFLARSSYRHFERPAQDRLRGRRG